MQVSVRSSLTAGVAVLGAGAMALSPIQPVSPSTALSPALTTSVAVTLAAAIDPITPIITTIQTTLANTTTLISDWIANPFPIASTVVNNWLYYLSELPAFGTIISQIVANLGNAFQAPFSPGTIDEATGLANGDNISALPLTTITPVPGVNVPTSQQDIFGLLPGVLPDATITALTPVLNFLNTPISGALLGLVGPVLAPIVALGNGISGAITAIQASDIAGAINDLINIPTTMINAFLNGGVTLDLTQVLGSALPSEVNSIGLALGGLLSTFTSTIASPQVPVGSVQVGGVGFDALALNATVPNPINPALPDITVNDPGIGIGLIGSVVSGTRTTAAAINSVPTAAASRRAPAAAKAAASVAKPAGKARAAAARHAG